MRDIKRIDRILKKIGKLWEKHPDQRLGQLLENYGFNTCASQTGTNNSSYIPVFYVEDTTTESNLDEELKK